MPRGVPSTVLPLRAIVPDSATFDQTLLYPNMLPDSLLKTNLILSAPINEAYLDGEMLSLWTSPTPATVRLYRKAYMDLTSPYVEHFRFSLTRETQGDSLRGIQVWRNDLPLALATPSPWTLVEGNPDWNIYAAAKPDFVLRIQTTTLPLTCTWQGRNRLFAMSVPALDTRTFFSLILSLLRTGKDGALHEILRLAPAGLGTPWTPLDYTLSLRGAQGVQRTLA